MIAFPEGIACVAPEIKAVCMLLFNKFYTGSYFHGDRNLFTVFPFNQNSIWILGKNRFTCLSFAAFPLQQRTP
jgi:hypothetical protein